MRNPREKSANESSLPARPAGVHSKEALHANSLFELQQAVGNQAVLRLLDAGYGHGKTLQKKCSCCSNGATCSKCGDEKKLHRGLAAQPIQPPDLSVQTRTRESPTVGERTETVGRAWCDLDQGKMLWEIKKQKIPKCMWGCAEAHEKAHVKFGRGECSKLSVFYKTAIKLSAEADRVSAALKKNPTKANAAKAEDLTNRLKKANADFRKALDAYTKWLEQTCREDEKQAYQADIDACTGPKVEKGCADLKETDRYKKMMKDAEEFKKNPSNCK